MALICRLLDSTRMSVVPQWIQVRTERREQNALNPLRTSDIYLRIFKKKKKVQLHIAEENIGH